MKLIVPVATGTQRMISHRSLAAEKEETSVIVPINPAQGDSCSISTLLCSASAVN